GLWMNRHDISDYNCGQRKTPMNLLRIVGLSALILVSAGLFYAGLAQNAAHPLVTRAQYEQWQTELSNWGRWGKDDQLGTLNLVTPAKRKQAAALVKDGVSVSL